MIHFPKLLDPKSSTYLSISQNDLLWGLSVTSVGFQKIDSGQEYPPVGHPTGYRFHALSGRILDEYQLVYIIKGEGDFASKSFEKRRLKAGSVFMLFPGEWHNYKPDENTGWEVWWVGFKGTIVDNLINEKFFLKTSPIFKIGFNDEVVQLFHKILGVANEGNMGFQQLAASMVLLILGYLSYTNKNIQFADKGIVNKVNEAKVIMTENPKTSPQDVAKLLNISYSGFRKIFRKYTGMSPSQYCIQQKIYRSKEFLISTDKSIMEISDILQFDSTYYFSTSFKNKTGMSPTEFRKKYLP